MGKTLLDLLLEGPKTKVQIMEELNISDSQFRSVKAGIPVNYDFKNKVYYLGENRPANETEIQVIKEIDKLDLPIDQIRKVLKNLQSINPRKYAPRKIEFSEDHVRFGVITDCHMGHICYRPDILDHARENFKRSGIEFIVNAGDTIEGMSGRDGHIYELTHLGATAQMKYFQEEMQKLEDWDVFSIEADSSHGGWFKSKGNAGLDIGPELEEKADNYKFIGYDEQDLILDNGLKIRLRHPGGGTAYAISYKMQKYVESIGGGDKPNIVIQGHFHKSEYMFHRNIHCFDGKTKITTDKGKIPIRDIKKGDKVLTHKNRYKKVVQLHGSNCDGNFVKIMFRNDDSNSDLISSTPEHPILVFRNKIKQWMPAKDVIIGDLILVNYIECKYCKKHLPYWRTSCNECISKHKNKNKSKYLTNKGGNEHYKKDILPRAIELQKQGYKIIPIGDVIPDIIAYKDGKLIAIEIEDGWIKQGKQEKYRGFEFVDEVRWEIINKGKEFSTYKVDKESGFVLVPVEKVKHHKKRNTKVYNLGVETDNSYVASNVVVHNCFDGGTICDQTPFMKKVGTPAHVGYWILDAYMTKREGRPTVERIQQEFTPFYD